MSEPSRFGPLFTDLADTALRHLPLYRHLALAIAADDEVAGLLELAPVEQRLPTLLLAAVHDVLLAGSTDPLVEWYSSIADSPRRVGPGADDPWPHFRRMALEHPGVRERVRTRATQTNEVGRCAPLVPALQALAREGRELGLVDLGTSAGLNLMLDHYRYRYHRPPDRTAIGVVEPVEFPGSGAGLIPVELDCELRGPLTPRLEPDPPPVVVRWGIDLNPVDLSDHDEARWLVACQWPDQPERIDRLRAALALARIEPAPIVEGEMVDRVAEVIDGVPADVLPVCVATWALAYLTPARQRDLLAELDGVGRRRDLSLVFSEQPVMVPGLGVPPRPDGRPDGGPTALVRRDWRDGIADTRRLADQHPHGAWLEWLDPTA